MTLTTITSKGQVTIPKNIRDLLHLYAGDKIEFIFKKSDEVILRPITKKVAEVCGGLSKYKLSNPVSVEQMDQAIKNKNEKKLNESS